MGRRSISKSPIAQLRQILGNMSAQNFAARHKLSLDNLKKIESAAASNLLSEKDAAKIATRYGLNPDSLRRKKGNPQTIDGNIASPATITAWQTLTAVSPSTKLSLAIAAGRQLAELILSASDDSAIRLATSYQLWQEEQLASNSNLAREWTDRATRYRVIFKGRKTVSEIDEILTSDPGGRITYNPLWKDVRRKINITANVTISSRRLRRSLVSFGGDEIVIAEQTRLFRVAMKDGSKLVQMFAARGTFRIAIGGKVASQAKLFFKYVDVIRHQGHPPID